MLDKMQSADSLRSHSVHLTNNGDNKQINFGDDQNITYSDEKIKLNHPPKKNQLDDSKDHLQLPENSASKGSKSSQLSFDADLTPIKINIPGQNGIIPEVDEASYGSPTIKNVIKPDEHDNLIAKTTNSEEKSGHKSENILSESKQKAKLGKQDEEPEDDDPYGLGTKTKKPSNYNPKDLEMVQTKLLSEFGQEFKDGLSAVENLPRGSIMLSAIKACLADENKLVKRGILDMVNNLVKLEDEHILNEQQKIELVESMLILLLRRDISVTRRIYSWCFGDADQDNNYVISDHTTTILHYIQEAFVDMFNTFDTSDPKTCASPLKILQNFYMDHEKAVDKTISRISLPMIRFIYMKGVKNNDERIKEEIVKSGIRFLSCIGSQFHLIVQEISNAIPSATDEDLINYCGIIRFLKDCFSNPDLSMPRLKVEVKLLEGLTSFLLKIKITDLIDSYISNDEGRVALTLEVLEIFTEIIDFLYDPKQNWTREELVEMVRSIPAINKALEDYEKDFIDLCKVLNTFRIEENCVIFKDASGSEQAIYEELPPGLIKALRYSILSVVIMQKVLYSTKPLDFNHFPQWMMSLVACIRSTEPHICKVSIEGLIYVISSKRVEKVFLKLKDMIKAQASNLMITLAMALQSEPSNFEISAGSIRAGAAKEKKVSIPELVIEKLWQLMDFQPFHDPAIKMLKEINTLVPELIIKNISGIIASSNYEEKEKAFQRFSMFWKITMSNSETKSDESLMEVNKQGLVMMIEFLDDENPLLRHAAKNWLIESIAFFERIIDPIVEDILKSTSFYVSESGQFFYTETYDTRKVYSRFKKLKNILQSISDLFSKFLLKNNLSPQIRAFTPNLLEGELLNPNKEDVTYFDLLIVLCIRFIQGQALESLSPVFAKDNQKVSSVACEFFDLLVTNIPQKALDIAKYVYKPLLIVQRHAVTNNNFEMQVQLLSLLKFIIFGKQTLNNPEKKNELLMILNSPMLMPKIIQGLRSRSPYVLLQYVNFINQSMQTLCEVLPAEDLDRLISQILKTYRGLIDRYSSGSVLEDESQIVIQEQNRGEASDFDISAKGRGGNLFENTGIQLQSNIMELNSILIEGIYFIYNYFLNIQEVEEASMKDSAKYSTNADNKLIKIITLGTLGNAGGKSEHDDPVHMEIAKSLVLTLKKTIKVFISCWTSAEIFDKYFNVYNLGMNIFSYEVFQEYNLTDDVDESTHIRNVKSLIIRIVRSLYIKFKDICMDTFLEVWFNEVKFKVYPPEQTKLFRAGKFMQILSSLHIPMYDFIKCLHNSRRVSKIITHYHEAPKKIKNNTIVLNQDIADMEAIILYYLYAFITFKNLAYVEDATKRRAFLTEIWTAMLEFLDVFKNPQHPNTTIWVLEIYHAFSSKYLPKDILDSRSIRSPMHINMNNLLLQLSSELAKEYRLIFRPDKSMLSYTVVPFPPSVFEYYLKHKESKDLFELTQNSESVLSQRYKLFSLIFLEKQSVSLMKNCYAANRMDRMTMRIRIYMDKIFTLLDLRDNETKDMVQFVSGLIHAQYKELGRVVIGEYEPNILHAFDNDDFFICTKKTLAHWMDIIQLTVSHSKEDLLARYLSKVAFSSYWSSEEHKNKTRIKSFSRACFIIFSGEPDTFMTKDKIKSLLDKIKEVIKDENAHPSLISLILFSMRVLILRLSLATLNEVLRKIWPTLITLMMTIFAKTHESKGNLKVMLEALKLLELISIKNIEEFYLYQWIFIYDYFGISFEQNETKKNIPSTSPFFFNPSISKLFPLDTHISYKEVSQVPTNVPENEEDRTMMAKRRHIIIKESTVNSEEELGQIATKFFKKMIQYTQEEYLTDLNEIENLIREDFISLDESLLTTEIKNYGA